MSLGIQSSEFRIQKCSSSFVARKVSLALLSASCLATLCGQTNDAVRLEEIPPLRGPKAEILPTFWEQHGLLVVLLTIAALVVVGVLLRLVFQKRPPALPSPAETARAELTGLQRRPADLDWHDAISAILRRYLVAALGLTTPSLTNRELCETIDAAGTQACEKARPLLLALDEHRFDPGSNPPVQNAIEQALAVIDFTEVHLHPPQTEAPTSPRSNT